MAGALVGVLAGLMVFAIWLSTLDVNAYKSDVIAEAQAATGRKVTLDGPLTLALWPDIALEAERAAVANVSWAGNAPLFEVRRLAIAVRLIPLLGGRLEIDRVTLSGVTVSLARNEAGQVNWTLGSEGDRVPRSGPLAVAIGNVQVDDLRVRYRDRGKAYDVTADTLRMVSDDGGDGSRRLSGRGRVEGIPWVLEGTSGPLRALVSPSVRFPFSMKLGLADSEFRAEGSWSESGTLAASVTLNARSLGNWSELAGTALPPVPLALSGRVELAKGKVSVEALEITSGRTKAEGKAVVDLSASPPHVEVAVRSERMVLAPLLVDARAASGSKGPSHPVARLVPDIPFPRGLLGAVGGKARLEVGTLTVHELTLTDVNVETRLGDSRIEILLMNAALGGNPVVGRVSIEDLSGKPSLAVEARATSLHTASALQAAGLEPNFDTQVNIDVALSGRGPDLRTWLAGSRGHARWMSGPGRLLGEAKRNVETLNAAVGGLATLLGTLQAKDTGAAPINCIAADFAIDDGVANVRALIADTEHATVVGTGSTSLKDESLRLKVDPRPKTVTLNVAVPLNVGGTWLKPSFAPQPAAVTRRAGAVAAAFLFPPSALLSLTGLATAGAAAVGGGWDGGSGDNPCLAVAKEGAKGDGKASASAKPPSPVQGVVTKVGETAKGAAEAIGGAVKQLFGN